MDSSLKSETSYWGDDEEREAREQLATVNGGRDERGRLQLATVGGTVTRQ